MMLQKRADNGNYNLLDLPVADLALIERAIQYLKESCMKGTATGDKCAVMDNELLSEMHALNVGDPHLILLRELLA